MSSTTFHAKELVLGMLFVTCVLASNLLSPKAIQLGPFLCSAGILAYPFTFLLTTLSAEWCGFEITRKMINTSLIACLMTILFFYLSTLLPTHTPHHLNPKIDAFDYFFDATQRVVWGSLLGFYAGDLLNALVLTRLKKFAPSPFWTRAFAAMFCGELLSGAIFSFTAYQHLASLSWKTLWLDVFLLKLLFMIIFLPILHIVQHLGLLPPKNKYWTSHTKAGRVSIKGNLG